jgi:transposase-like protein
MNPDSPASDSEVPGADREVPAHNPEVRAKASRRHYSNEDKVRILDAFESASPIERASLCRREGVYVNAIYRWRRQRNAGSSPAVKRGPKPNPQAREQTASERRIALLEEKLKKAEQVIDIQGKVYALLRACAGESADSLVLLPWQK